MYYLKPGEACALSMVLCCTPEASPIMARAVSETDALMVPIETMSEWMGKYKSWYQFVIETYRSCFDELLLTIDSVAFRGMDERLEFYLKRAQGSRTQKHYWYQSPGNCQWAQHLPWSNLPFMEEDGTAGKVKLNRNSIEITSGCNR